MAEIRWTDETAIWLELREGENMNGINENVQELVLKLPVIEKARLVDKLLESMNQPVNATDKLWKKGVENRIKAYKAGKIKSVSFKKVLSQ